MPAVTGRGSSFTADRIREDPECLTSAPQAVTARPAARMFFAALMSRSCRVPQDGHCHVLVLRLSSASRYPHAEQVFELGYHRSITIRCLPALAALYESMRRKVPQPQSEMALARDRLRTMPATFRSSITITSWSRTSRADVRCRKSCRDARTLRWARATLALALARLALPFWQRASRRW